MNKISKKLINFQYLKGGINMAAYAKPVERAFIVSSNKAKEFINHSSKKEIEKIYSMADKFDEIFCAKKTK